MIGWSVWIQDRVNDFLALVERGVVALERIADASEEVATDEEEEE